MISSPYSPFFNSGLLAGANTPGSTARRRSSSLPDSITPRTSSGNSAYYLSLQRRDQSRSFLSLDLAESRLSERHGPQTTWLIPPVPALPPLSVSPLRSHFSTSNSLRSLSPHPPPTLMLPDPPPPPYSVHHTHPRTPPRLPELPVLPALQIPTYTKTPQRPLPDPPSPKHNLSPTDDDHPSRSSVLTKPKHLRSKKPKNLGIVTDFNRLSKASVSTASTRVRRKNRWDALDALEGRRKPDPIPSPFIPPVPSKNNNPKLNNLFVKPSTFASPAKPLPRPKYNQKYNPKSPNFMSMSDDSDPGPRDSSDSDHHQPTTHNINPLLEPEDIVLPPPPPSTHRSYLNVQGDNDEQEEEGIVLKATRCPPLLSPPPPTIVTAQSKPAQRTRLKGIPLNPKPSIQLAPKKVHTTKDKDRSKPSDHHHHHSSSRRHKPSTSSRPNNAHANNNHCHYKSFIDLDDLLDQETEAVKPPKQTAPLRPRKREDPEADLALFEWRGRVGRGIAEGGGDWVWV